MSGRDSMETALVDMLVAVPHAPHTTTYTISKLNTCITSIVPKNCLIKPGSGLTVRYIATRKIAIMRAI